MRCLTRLLCGFVLLSEYIAVGDNWSLNPLILTEKVGGTDGSQSGWELVDIVLRKAQENKTFPGTSASWLSRDIKE